MSLAQIAQRLIARQRLAKSEQPGLLPGVPPRPGLTSELRRDKRGHAQRRWVRKVRHFTATGSSLKGKHPDLGVMTNATTSGVSAGVKEGRMWGMDNGAYSGKFSPDVLLNAMDRYRPHRDTCKFVVAPDVLGDGPATEAMYRQWRPIIRQAGYPVAFVLHRGTTKLPDCDALFVPALNLDDPHVPRLVEEARRAGKWVHVGRVNSAERTSSMYRLGADSVDGTHTRFKGMDQGTADQGAWMDAANAQGAMPTLLTEQRPLESADRYARRVQRSRLHQQAQRAGAQVLSTLPAGAVDAGDLVSDGAGRVGILRSAPEDGWVLVAFTDPLHPDVEPDIEDVPTRNLFGPLSLGAPHRAAQLTARQLAGIPRK